MEIVLTSTNIRPVEQAISAFHRLDQNDQLGVLALLFKQVSGSVPANALNSDSTQNATGLIAKLQKLSEAEQVSALRDFLPVPKRNEDGKEVFTTNAENEVVLDPNPAQALVDLVQGGHKVPTGDYSALNPETKLAFWYLLAQKLGTSIVGIPSEYTPPEQGLELLQNLNGLSTDDLVLFLSHVL